MNVLPSNASYAVCRGFESRLAPVYGASSSVVEQRNSAFTFHSCFNLIRNVLFIFFFFAVNYKGLKKHP